MNAVCWSEGLNQQTYQFALSYELQKRRKSFFYDIALLYNLQSNNPQELWKLNIHLYDNNKI